MSGVTGIELGPNCCVLVRGVRIGSHGTVSAASAIAPSVWSDEAHALVRRIREARLRHDLPRRARVVAWNGDVTLAPLVHAGFVIASVLSPAQALARVVRARQVGTPRGTAIAALSLNTHGAAIAIVAGTEVICSRVVEWSLGTPFKGAHSALLDRYLLVSQIAPQLQHVIDLVRPVNGVTVGSVVLCGNLPDMRSLAMLLVDELDIEVETLDSAALLGPNVTAGCFGGSVASLQLAAAVASSGENRVPVYARSEPRASGAQGQFAARRSGTLADRLSALMTIAALACCAAWAFPQVAGSSPALPLFPDGDRTAVAAVSERPELRLEPTVGRVAAYDALLPEPRSAPLSPSLPTVQGTLIAGVRRLAIVSGSIVAAGDPIGPRAIARIERAGVVLREPSGREVYVGIRLPSRPAPVRERLLVSRVVPWHQAANVESWNPGPGAADPVASQKQGTPTVRQP